MKEAHLRDFIAVADAGSVRGAARRLKVTQGAVSKNLIALERSFGVPLLLRSAHGVEPTRYGRVLLRRARLADAELRKAQEEISSLAGHHQSVLSIGMSSTAEALLAAPAIAQFRRKYPDALVNLRGGTAPTLIALLREGHIELAVTPTVRRASHPDIRSEPIVRSQNIVVARYDHPLAHATDIAQIADCEWVHGSRPDDVAPGIVAAFESAGLPPPRFAARRDSFSALMFLLLGSDLLSLASEPAVAPFCREGLLTRVPLRNVSIGLEQSLITVARRPLTPRAAALATILRRIARGLGSANAYR